MTVAVKRLFVMVGLRTTLAVLAALTAFLAPANGQVISLLVGNQLSFNGVDRYAFTNGSYQGAFVGPGTAGPPGIYFFTYGPNNDIYYSPNASPSQVLRANGMTGNFISTFIPTNGGVYQFGADTNLYRLESTGTIVRRYNGTTGSPIDTFVSSGLNSAGVLRFGPAGDLFITDQGIVKRFSGTTGQFLGNFTQPGAGGVGSMVDFLFAPNGSLLVSSPTLPDRVFQFNGTTGAFEGYIGVGSGLNGPYGLTIGPDGNLYVASTSGNTIKEYELSSGAFLGNFVSSTAHVNPAFIGFAPFPIPEPSSLALVVIAVTLGAIRTTHRRQSKLFAKERQCTLAC